MNTSVIPFALFGFPLVFAVFPDAGTGFRQTIPKELPLPGQSQ
jgi:hypothetical protein